MTYFVLGQGAVRRPRTPWQPGAGPWADTQRGERQGKRAFPATAVARSTATSQAPVPLSVGVRAAAGPTATTSVSPTRPTTAPTRATPTAPPPTTVFSTSLPGYNTNYIHLYNFYFKKNVKYTLTAVPSQVPRSTAVVTYWKGET